MKILPAIQLRPLTADDVPALEAAHGPEADRSTGPATRMPGN